MREPFIGQIAMHAGNIQPKGWAFCDGRSLSIKEYPALFSILQTSYGGDGRTYFNLPDLRGRTPLGMGQAPDLSAYKTGQQGGSEKITLTGKEMPKHTHSAAVQAANTNLSSENEPGGRVLAYDAFAGSTPYSLDTRNLVEMSSRAVDILPSGDNQAHNNMQPYFGINFIIALEGIFPAK